MKLAVLLTSLLVALSANAAELPTVAASIRPVHAVAAEVMGGIATPQLILNTAGSLHTHALRPSEARLLAEAEVVFWIGPSLEAHLAKPLEAIAGKARIVTLINAHGVETLPSRAAGLRKSEEAGASTSTLPDGHIWLDPRNAVAMANAMADALAVADPINAERYWANAEVFSRNAMILDKDLHIRLAPVREKPLLALHDATQYFQARYRLATLGSVSITPDQLLGAGRLAAIQERLREVKAVCIFSGPQFEPRTVQMLVEGSAARTRVLDAEGAGLEIGQGHYFALMRGLADDVLECLS